MKKCDINANILFSLQYTVIQNGKTRCTMAVSLRRDQSLQPGQTKVVVHQLVFSQLSHLHYNGSFTTCVVLTIWVVTSVWS